MEARFQGRPYVIECGVCGCDSDAMVLIQNSYGEWLCLPCNEWVFHLTIEPHDYNAFTPEDIERIANEDEQPWLRSDYVPEGTEPL